MALNALEPLDGSTGLQAVGQDGNALGVASAAALELHIENMTVDDIKADLLGADPLGLESKVLIHNNLFLSVN